MIFILGRRERELIERLRSIGGAAGAAGLTDEVLSLKRQIADLHVQRSQITEDFEKRERELRHMVGLERQRQEEERKQQVVKIDQASAAARLEVREANLVAEKERFEEQLTFNTERFATMEKYLKDMLADILARLPNVNVDVRR